MDFRRDSNSNCQNRNRARWPLDHGPFVTQLVEWWLLKQISAHQSIIHLNIFLLITFKQKDWRKESVNDWVEFAWFVLQSQFNLFQDLHLVKNVHWTVNSVYLNIIHNNFRGRHSSVNSFCMSKLMWQEKNIFQAHKIQTHKSPIFPPFYTDELMGQCNEIPLPPPLPLI